MRHSGGEASVRVTIVDVFVVKSQWNTPRPATNPTRLDLWQSRPYSAGVLYKNQESLVAKTRSELAKRLRQAGESSIGQ